MFQSQKNNLWNVEKKIKIEKNILESRKIFHNRENYFRMKKTIAKLGKMFQNWENFVIRVEKKSWIQWTLQLTFTCLSSTIETLENGVKYV